MGEPKTPDCGHISRRRFCTQMGAGVGLLFVGACEPPARLSTGGLDDTTGDTAANTGSNGNGNGGGNGGGGGNGNGSAVDLGSSGGGRPDMTTGGGGRPDMATGGGSSTCPTGSSMINAGASSQFPSGTYKVISASGYVLFICHDSGGLFAMDASCPHEGVTLTKRTSDIYCRRHGATFDLNGQHPTSPAFSPLDHYPVCVDGSGNILVDVSRTVSATTRA